MQSSTRLFLSLAFLGALATALAVVGMFAAGRAYVQNEALAASEHWAEVVRTRMTALKPLLRGAKLSAEDRRILQFAAETGNVMRFKIFDATGKIVHASRKKDIGKRSEESYFYDRVALGHKMVKIGDLFNNDRLIGESYIPIMENGKFLGALEVYVDVTAAMARFRRVSSFAALALVLVLAMTGAAQFFFIWRHLQRRRAAERRKDLARVKAEQANQSKSSFLAHMSHELRTPLNAIMGFSEVLKDAMFGPNIDERYKQYAGYIHRSGAHLLSLINDLLDLSKIEAGHYELHEEDIELPKALGNCVEIMREQAEREGLELRLELAADLPLLHADLRSLDQILLNLISNAVKFTPRGGHITIGAGLDAKRGLTISVADTGIGIAEEDIAKVMEPFAQVAEHGPKSKKEGTGLGLALTRYLAELHGGSVRLESEVERGTTVFVYFPSERMGKGTPAPAPEEAVDSGSATLAEARKSA